VEAPTADPISILTNFGWSNYSTASRYIKMAGVVFPDAAAARAERLLSTRLSTDLSESQDISENSKGRNEAEARTADAA
jgi:hypothetical protein